ncbi:heavy metal translocating P-type ATPase metal-binding domain-containing protein [Flavobacteriaceae bacterium S356]|uniref:Heavy metal translocating P-type ATPase metal-binding domain-containing protein n=1 Tax=Asprobacillus argus TaxID=3076534 RepID=A0ABU3LIQ4_9FLAO|nr:heavy metal translocating P-type ATPase metal-binding domain-containing protein [Flavobacteriaceae bacterium S356]
MENKLCFHCGDTCDKNPILVDQKPFCCNGCKTVYQIFTENDLSCYYDLQNNPGAIPDEMIGKFDYLDNKDVVEKLLEFDDGGIQVVNLYIPHIHCSSCIWVLENLYKLQKSVTSSQVNFPKKTVRITFNSNELSLKELVLLLNSIGYEPYISLEDYDAGKKQIDRSLYYKLGIAGFAFGNVMFLSFPEYFEVSEYWLDKYKFIFRWLMLIFSLPVVFYAADSYFISAYKGIKSKILNIDVPIALGILVLFLRSVVEVVLDLGTGFFDSLTGLVFFLLLGKFFQQRTYSYLSFERDYKSYFPIAVTRITNGKEENVQIYDIKKGDRLLIRNQELIPVDGILINGNGQIDYSFVTGESKPVSKRSGDKIFAGGKQLRTTIEMEVLTTVSQSYLTQLWSNDVFRKDKESSFKTLTDRISKHFTAFVLSIATISTVFWLFKDYNLALNVFTSVLIIACPCAIALAAPFTLGNMLRIFGRQKFYLKNAHVIERLAAVDTAIFDKTGTITTNTKSTIIYEGALLDQEERAKVKSVMRQSNHPLSRALDAYLSTEKSQEIDEFEEVVGKGIQGVVDGEKIKIGSSSFVIGRKQFNPLRTEVHISINEKYKGVYSIKNSYRTSVAKLFSNLSTSYKLSVLSGDNESEKETLKQLVPESTTLIFNQKPNDKLNYIKELQEGNKSVLMVGDGLNDAGALAQSDVGISLSENINVFSPASDAILDARSFSLIPKFLELSNRSIQIIKQCFLLSLCYNSIGLYFAVTGQLEPVIAAILMPLSSISVVIFTTIVTNIEGKKIKNNDDQ